MAAIPFTGNHQDLSTSRGFQFKFGCEKCGNGYSSTFKPNKLGTAASVANAAAGLLGGIFGGAARTAESLRELTSGPQHDAAQREAVEEISKIFKQCTRCGQWVCEPVCWNAKAGLCETCAPDLDEEIAAAQATAAKQQVAAKVRDVDFVGQRDLSKTSAAVCAKCGAKTHGAKFCPECGTPTAVRRKCGSCGAESEGAPKFCPECGGKYG